jgi:hypothetical protein
MKKIPIIAVVGPTASGKTELAVALAKKLSALMLRLTAASYKLPLRIIAASTLFSIFVLFGIAIVVHYPFSHLSKFICALLFICRRYFILPALTF